MAHARRAASSRRDAEGTACRRPEQVPIYRPDAASTCGPDAASTGRPDAVVDLTHPAGPGTGPLSARKDVQSPVDVDAPLAAGVDEVAAGDRHTCARKGVEVYCFGNDYNGAVGISYFGPVPEPKLVAVPQVMHIDVGRERSGAVSGDARELMMWGVPHLGDGGTMLSPQPVYADIDGVAQLAVGYDHTCALKTTGEVLCWGENNHGQLGVGLDVAAQPSPVLVRLAPP
ncbi:RCC1 domain-containing protein [Sorangium sp. So ce1128]